MGIRSVFKVASALALGIGASLMVAATPASAGNAFSVTIDQAAGQLDPTSTSPVLFDVVFGSITSDFLAGDVTLAFTGTGTLNQIVVQGADAAHYTVQVSGMTSSGVLTATIAAGVATNQTQGPNAASTSTDNTVEFIFVAPTTTTVAETTTTTSVAPTTTVPATTTTPTVASTVPNQLPETGTSSATGQMAALAAVVLAFGLAAVVLSRRRPRRA